jgi:hypothetical protein
MPYLMNDNGPQPMPKFIAIPDPKPEIANNRCSSRAIAQSENTPDLIFIFWFLHLSISILISYVNIVMCYAYDRGKRILGSTRQVVDDRCRRISGPFGKVDERRWHFDPVEDDNRPVKEGAYLVLNELYFFLIRRGPDWLDTNLSDMVKRISIPACTEEE